jgi:transmembrane sensor
MTEKEFKELIDRFLKGEATVEEEKLLREYETFLLSKHKGEIFRSDLEKLGTKQEVYSGIKKKILGKRKKWLAVAASIAMLIGVGSTIWYNQHNNPETMVVSNSTELFKKITLGDGSTAILKKGGKLRYADNFKGTRHVVLEGEAFFEVKRNEKKPFVVHTGDIRTKVLGTSFNVAERDSDISITVATGLVEVSDKNKAVKLRPNQRTLYRPSSKSFETININHNLFTSWFRNSIKLEGIRIDELARFISYKYGSEVKFLDHVAKNNRMTISLKPEDDLQTLIQNINYINELRITKPEEDMIAIELK